MKSFLKISVLVLALLALPTFGFADTLQLVSANSGTTPNGAEDVGPYSVTVNGTPANLYCLDLARDMTFGETWTASPTTLSTHSPLTEKEAAIILSQINSGQITNSVGQLEIWAINDLNDARADGLTQNEQNYLYNVVQNDANNSNQFGNSFYSQFTDYVAVNDSQSTGGEAQDFIGQSVPTHSPVPEPSSLILLGTGLFGAAGAASRRSKIHTA